MSACLLARAKLAQYVAKLKESSTAEKLGTGIKAGYLASAKTIMRNDIGNAAIGGVEYLATRPLAVATDYISSIAKSAASFGKVKPHEYREIANTLNMGGLARGAKGIRDGIAQATELLRTGVDQGRMDKFEVGETTFANPVLDKTVHFVFNFMEANDKPFFGFALQSSLYGRARLMGIREGLRGAKLSARTNELLKAPTDEMMMGAMSDAEYVTFKNSTALSDAAAGLRTSIRQKSANAPAGRKLGYSAMSLGLDLTIPFTKVASAIANASIDYSPAGFAKALITAADRDPKVQAQLSQQLSRATLGTGLLMLGYAMQGNGTINTSSSSADRSLADVENKGQNSILLGGKWRSITFLGPLAIPLLTGASLRAFSESKKDAGLGSKAAVALGSIGKTMTEQSYLQSLSNVIEALNDPAGKGVNAVAGMIPIPAIVGQTATALDPVQRQGEGLLQRVQSRTPILSRSLQPRLNQFGDTAKKTSGGLGGAAESFLDISNSRTDASSPITKEMERLDVTLPSFGRNIKLPHSKAPVRRSAEEYNAVLSEFGPIKRQMVESLIASPDYQNATDADKKTALERVLAHVQTTGNRIDRARRLGASVPRLSPSLFSGANQ